MVTITLTPAEAREIVLGEIWGDDYEAQASAIAKVEAALAQYERELAERGLRLKDL